MNSQHFVLWLKGFLDNQPGNQPLTLEQRNLIQKYLNEAVENLSDKPYTR